MDSTSEGKCRDIPKRGSISVPNRKTTCHDERKKTAPSDRVTEGTMTSREAIECHRNPDDTNLPLIDKKASTSNTETNTQSINPARVTSASENSIRSTMKLQLVKNGTSLNSVCGPNPKKIFRWIIAICFIWITFIIVMNIYKKVSSLEEELRLVSEEMQEVQNKYIILKRGLLKGYPHSNNKINTNFPITGDAESDNSDISDSPTDTWTLSPPSMDSISTLEANPHTCYTESGKKCIFPFYYEETEMTSCQKRWRDIKPWCATKVDKEQRFIDDSSAWDWCSENCLQWG